MHNPKAFEMILAASSIESVFTCAPSLECASAYPSISRMDAWSTQRTARRMPDPASLSKSRTRQAASIHDSQAETDRTNCINDSRFRYTQRGLLQLGNSRNELRFLFERFGVSLLRNVATDQNILDRNLVPWAHHAPFIPAQCCALTTFFLSNLWHEMNNNDAYSRILKLLDQVLSMW